MTDKPQKVILDMGTDGYFNKLAELMCTVAPPAAEDAPILARMIRGSALAIREEVYVTAARALGASPMRLGLDLQGGSHIMLKLERQDIVKERLETTVSDIRTNLRDANIRYTW